MSKLTWKLKQKDGTTEEFLDIRRKVGNQIIRAYLIDDILQEGKIRHIEVSLRGPKNEFKDFSNYFVLHFTRDGDPIKILVEAGVYENLRIVGTDSSVLSDMPSAEIIQLFTDVVKNPDAFETFILLSPDSMLISKS